MFEIDKCPSCGKADKAVITARTITYWNNRKKFRVICNRCGWQGPEKDTEEKSVEAWNKRYDNK